MSIIEKLKYAVFEAQADFSKAESGNKSATTRARKQLAEIKKLAQEGRIHLLALKKASNPISENESAGEEDAA